MARHLGLTGPAWTISTACSSSARAFISGQRLLAAGLVDAVLVGGADSLCGLTLNGFDSLESLSCARCQPFDEVRQDQHRRGAALFLLSRMPAPLALLGAGESSDAWHISAPHPDGIGAEAAMQMALAQAGLTPAQVGYVNLHGTATRLNDAMESQAVHRLFGAEVPCSSTKPLTGHALGAAGCIEAALACLLLERALPLPPQRVTTPDPALAPIRLVNGEVRWRRPGCSPTPLPSVATMSACCLGASTMNEPSSLPAIETLLPHQAPMLLLDRLCAADAQQARCETRIGARHALLLDGEGNLPGWVGIELMAQTIAAWAGMQGGCAASRCVSACCSAVANIAACAPPLLPVACSPSRRAACCKTAAWPVLIAGSCWRGGVRPGATLHLPAEPRRIVRFVSLRKLHDL